VGRRQPVQYLAKTVNVTGRTCPLKTPRFAFRCSKRSVAKTFQYSCEHKAATVRFFRAYAEVDQTDAPFMVADNVIWFYVSMNYASSMGRRSSLHDLSEQYEYSKRVTLKSHLGQIIT
jgi:hypothetical protein